MLEQDIIDYHNMELIPDGISRLVSRLNRIDDLEIIVPQSIDLYNHIKNYEIQKLKIDDVKFILYQIRVKLDLSQRSKDVLKLDIDETNQEKHFKVIHNTFEEFMAIEYDIQAEEPKDIDVFVVNNLDELKVKCKDINKVRTPLDHEDVHESYNFIEGVAVIELYEKE